MYQGVLGEVIILMAYTFLVDFGSTFTKLCVFDLDNEELVMTTKYPTTISTDPRIGLFATFDEAKRYIGDKEVRKANIIASSSVAGGLRMVVVGLTKKFSLMAGKNVALNAGARVIKTYDNYLTDKDVGEIEQINPEILLLCGGIEGGNTDRIVFNAEKLKSANISSYIVYAGNSEIATYVRQILAASSIKCYIAENVFPQHGQLNTKIAGNIIRNLFMERIVGAKGLRSVFDVVGSILMPTPAAVLLGGELLSRGLGEYKGIGNLVVFDVGGATTDVYSYIDDLQDNVNHKGMPETFSKRTVEGDLGIRSSCMSLLESMNLKEISRRISISDHKYLNYCHMRADNGAFIPDDDMQKKIDFTLTESAVRISARRHCGKIRNAYAKNATHIIEGRDLTKINNIVGTGGAIIHSIDPVKILSQAIRKTQEKEMLLPEKTDFYIDKKYILYAVGLAASINPNSALNIAKENIIKIN